MRTRIISEFDTSSRLLRQGHHTRIVAFGNDPEPLLHIIQSERPDVVGFSLIFQYMVPQFATIIRGLRMAGVQAHITIGGHYASFEPAELLRYIPELDSVVRFEGEDTLLEIVEHLDHPSLWRQVPGIALLDQGKPVLNPPRQGRTHIDDFPEPDRRDIDYRQQDLRHRFLHPRMPMEMFLLLHHHFLASERTTGRRAQAGQIVDEVEHLVTRPWRQADSVSG